MIRIPLFNSQHLEAACRVLADTERGLSGSQIERLLQEIKVVDTSPSMTKWKRLYNALVGAQNQYQVGNHLIMFINRAMNPVNYARDPAVFTWRRDELNVVLAFSGFYVREDGKVTNATKATTLDSARARAGRLKAALESRAVHASCRTSGRKLFSCRLRGDERGCGTYSSVVWVERRWCRLGEQGIYRTTTSFDLGTAHYRLRKE